MDGVSFYVQFQLPVRAMLFGLRTVVFGWNGAYNFIDRGSMTL